MKFIRSVTALLLVLSQGAKAEQRFLRTQTVPIRDNRELQQADFRFVEEDGLVVMEAESVPVVEPWKNEAIFDGYTGTGHIRFNGNNIWVGNATSPMSYFIEINNPGEYYMLLRARKNITVDGSLGNDCYTRLVNHPGFRGKDVKTYLGGPTDVYSFATKQEFHEEKFLAEYNLDAKGTYEFQVSGRSKHFLIDRIVFYKQDSVAKSFATDIQRAESARLPGIGAPPSPIQALELTTAGTVSDFVLLDIEQGAVIDFADVGNRLSITARTTGSIGFVRFDYGNGLTRTESGAPYTISGDSGPDSIVPSPFLAAVGDKTVSITAFDKEGNQIDTKTVSFTLINTVIAPTTAPPTFSPTSLNSASKIARLSLMTAGSLTDSFIGEIKDGDDINIAIVGEYLSIYADTEGPVGKVIFFYGGTVWTESGAPYAMAGNFGADAFPVPYLASTGPKSLRVELLNAAGLRVDTYEITFTISNFAVPTTPSPTAAPIVRPGISSVKLMTADKVVDDVIQELADGDVVSQADAGTLLSIQAFTQGDVAKVVFGYGGTFKTESKAPYAMSGNKGPSNNPVPYLESIGEKNIVVRAFNANNQVIDSVVINFSIVA